MVYVLLVACAGYLRCCFRRVCLKKSFCHTTQKIEKKPLHTGSSNLELWSSGYKFLGGFQAAFKRRLIDPVRKNWLKILTVSLIVLMCVVLVFRSDVVYGKMLQASVFYSTTDIKAYDAGVWLQQNYPNNATVVDTEVPGFWFSAFSGKNVIAETAATVNTNDIAGSVLSLSYQIQDPQNLLQAYDAYGDISEENYVSINQVWYRVSFSSTARGFCLFHSKWHELQFSSLRLSARHNLHRARVVPLS